MLSNRKSSQINQNQSKAVFCSAELIILFCSRLKKSERNGDIIHWRRPWIRYFNVFKDFLLFPLYFLFHLPTLLYGGYEVPEQRHSRREFDDLCWGFKFLIRASQHFSFPIHRFHAFFFSHFIFYILLLYTAYQRHFNNDLQLDIIDVLIMIISLGFWMDAAREMRTQKRSMIFFQLNLYINRSNACLSVCFHVCMHVHPPPFTLVHCKRLGLNIF